nr:putative integron gene cassette protein [uncultured bacterium]
MSLKHLEGGCFCGAIRYKLTETPSGSMICHCNTCRNLFSAPVVAWLTVAFDHFSFTKGSPATFATTPPVKRWFCQTCGTHVAYVHADNPDYVEVATCSLDNPSTHPPTHHSWLSDDITWVSFGDGLPTFQKSRYGSSA